jgi:pimeloyl-ACP methyl ester carboxylesterase
LLLFSAGDSTRLAADLLPGTGPDSVLVVPGFWRTRRDPVMVGIAERMRRAGLSVCTLDNRGHGESGGTFGFNTAESDDLVTVIESLQREGLVPGAVCLVGFSAGGAIALSTAARRPDLVRGLVLVSPVSDFKRVFPRPNPFRLDRHLSLRSALRPPRFWWYETRRRHALDDAGLVTAPVCLIHARNDWLVHHSHSEAIASRLRSPPEIHIIDMERAHAERMLAVDERPWSVLFQFMSRMLGMSMSGE